jgi:hypothetical protein
MAQCRPIVRPWILSSRDRDVADVSLSVTLEHCTVLTRFCITYHMNARVTLLHHTSHERKGHPRQLPSGANGLLVSSSVAKPNLYSTHRSLGLEATLPCVRGCGRGPFLATALAYVPRSLPFGGADGMRE